MGTGREQGGEEISGPLCICLLGQRDPHRTGCGGRHLSHRIHRLRQDVLQHRDRCAKQHRPLLRERQRQEISYLGKLQKTVYGQTHQGRQADKEPLPSDTGGRNSLRRGNGIQAEGILLPVCQRRHLLRRSQKHLPHRGGTLQETGRTLCGQARRQDAGQPL